MLSAPKSKEPGDQLGPPSNPDLIQNLAATTNNGKGQDDLLGSKKEEEGGLDGAQEDLDAESERPTIESLQERRRRMEEENAKRKQLLARAIADR